MGGRRKITSSVDDNKWKTMEIRGEEPLAEWVTMMVEEEECTSEEDDDEDFVD